MITTAITAEYVRGAIDCESTPAGLRPHRLTPASRAQLGGPVEPKVFSDPSGVRLVFRTESTELVLCVIPEKLPPAEGAPDVPQVYDVWVNGALHAQIESAQGNPTSDIQVSGLPEGDTLVDIWLPIKEQATLVHFRSDQPVHAAPEERQPVTWLHHGSSISHGADVYGASHTWPAVAARQSGVELINLGFGGNAMLDPFTARTIRDTEAEVISLKFGINLVNADTFVMRSFTPAVHGFLDTIREGRHAQTPLLMVSAIWCGIQENDPGPCESYFEEQSDGSLRRRFRAIGDMATPARGRLTLSILRTELERIITERMASDPHLHFLSGLQMYSEQDAQDLPLPDDLHPDTATHRMMGERFAEAAFGPEGPLAVS